MKRTTVTLLTSLIIANGFAISSAMAAPGDQQGQPQPQQPIKEQGQPQDKMQGMKRMQNMKGMPGMQHQDHHDGHGQRDHHQRHHAERFEFHGNNFRRGHAMPKPYRGEQYRVNDWRARGLPQPPQGHYWAAVNGNYVLAAAATGIITSIILNGALSH